MVCVDCKGVFMFCRSKKCIPKKYLVEYKEITENLTTYDITFYFDTHEIKGTVSDILSQYKHYFKELNNSYNSSAINRASDRLPYSRVFHFNSEDGKPTQLLRTNNMTYKLTERETKAVTYTTPVLKEIV